MSGRNAQITQQEFERLYDEYKPRFMLMAQSYIRNEMVVEDIVTDSFVYFWENRARIELTSGIPAYIFSSVRHGCLVWLRNQRNRMRIQQQLHSTAYRHLQERITALEACDPEALFADEVARIVRQQVDRMPDTMRRVFIYSRFEGKTYQEIADLLSITVRNVTAYIQKALLQLREALKDFLPATIIFLVSSLLHL